MKVVSGLLKHEEYGDRCQMWAFEAEGVAQRFGSSGNILETGAICVDWGGWGRGHLDGRGWGRNERWVSSGQKVWPGCQGTWTLLWIRVSPALVLRYASPELPEGLLTV